MAVLLVAMLAACSGSDPAADKTPTEQLAAAKVALDAATSVHLRLRSSGIPESANGVLGADGSGTSFIFTNYLSKVNPEWQAKVGEGTAVNWPTGAGGKGNEGVAAFVGRLPNSIGYVEYAYVKQNKMTYTLLKNKAGNFVAPEETAFKSAASSADWATSFYQVLTEQPGKDAWPITGATFILMQKTQDKPAQAAISLKFFEWAYVNGDKMATDLEYVPLPEAVKALSRRAWADIKVKTIIEKSWGEIKDASGKAIAYK